MYLQEFLNKYNFKLNEVHKFQDRNFYSYAIINNKKIWKKSNVIHIAFRIKGYLKEQFTEITLGTMYVDAHIPHTEYFINFGYDNKVYNVSSVGVLNEMRKDLRSVAFNFKEILKN